MGSSTSANQRKQTVLPNIVQFQSLMGSSTSANISFHTGGRMIILVSIPDGFIYFGQPLLSGIITYFLLSFNP